MKSYFETNKNENTTYKNSQDVEKTSKMKFIVIMPKLMRKKKDHKYTI